MPFQAVAQRVSAPYSALLNRDLVQQWPIMKEVLLMAIDLNIEVYTRSDGL